MSEAGPNPIQEQMGRIEELLNSLAKLGNPTARVVAQELVQLLLTLHGTAWARMIEHLRGHPGAQSIINAWAQDELIGSLLLLHGLHPVSLDTRVRQALDQLQPVLREQGGELELVAIAEKLVRVRMRGKCRLEAKALEQAIQQALAVHAPDVQVVEVENAAGAPEDSPYRISLPIVT